MKIDHYIMDEKELMALIQQGEGYNLEFKESISDNLGKEICALANANGGKILIGVDDKGKVVGVIDSNKLRSEIQSIARNLNPHFSVIIDYIGKVLVITVPEGNNKPYSVGGKFYLRNGTNSQQLERDEIRSFFEKEGIILF